jgi:CheY-like chemotaxis protein
VDVGVAEHLPQRTDRAGPDRPRERAAGGQLRVLVAEDNPLNQLFARELLERMGHEAVSASDGVEALDILARGKFDLVLMDVQMPKLGGVEATHRIRAGEVRGCRPDIPVVALTAHAFEGDRERFLAAGMDEYLSKPFDMDSLGEVLRRLVLERRRHGDEIPDGKSAVREPPGRN